MELNYFKIRIKNKKIKMAKEFSFEDLNKEMNKFSSLGSTLDKSEISLVDGYIHSGNYMLNAVLTGSFFKGYPGNRAVELAGPSGSGKTYLLLNAVKSAIEQGYYVIFYDSENAVDRELVEKFGIDSSKIRYEVVNTVQEFRTSIVNLLSTMIEAKRKGSKIPKIFVALDSVGNLATQKEVDDALSGSEKADMTRAKVIKSIFRIIMTKLAEVKGVLMFTNHTYQTQDLFSRQVASGGTGREYGASIILYLAKKQLKEGTTKTGIIVKIKPNKNRFAKPNEAEIHINFTKGMNPFIGVEKYISYENCGIQKGNFISEKEYEKLTDKEKEKCFIDEIKDGDETTQLIFKPKDSARKLCVKHLRDTVTPAELFTPKVLTPEVLKEIDDKIIQKEFQYATDVDEFDDIDAILENSNSDEDDD
jgi:RecA/RadA recombinase